MAELAVSGPNATALRITEISVRFGGIVALEDVSLEVPAGQVKGLIGPNGAGKTTLINVITGLQAPSGGRVKLGDTDMTTLRPHRRARLGLARTFQRLELFGTLTARENVVLAAEISSRDAGRTPGELADELLDRLGIASVAHQPTDALPTGLARLVELARALATSPRVLLLDEPSSGLDAHETSALGAVLDQLAHDGMGVLLVEHDMSLVMAVCGHITVLDHGQVIASGDPAAIRADGVVQAAYLGRERGLAVGAPGGAATAVIAESGPPVVAGAELRVTSTSAPSGIPVEAPRLELVDLHAGYGRIEVLHGASLSIRRGTAFALLGPNGAGKSTLLKTVSGRLASRRGTVSLDGDDVTAWSSERLARWGMCAIPEGRVVFPNLTVVENLVMYTYRRRGLKASDIEERAFGRFPRLAERRRQLAGNLSGGEQHMLALARALTTDPQLILIDELSMGLAPRIVDELYEHVASLMAAEGLTVLVVEQFARSALEVVSAAAIMINGRVGRPGAPGDIGDEVNAAYLGATA